MREQLRQAKEIEDHVQWLLRTSDQARNGFYLYKIVPELGKERMEYKIVSSFFFPDKFVEDSKTYRKYFQEEILGKFDQNPCCLRIHVHEKYMTRRDGPDMKLYWMYIQIFLPGAFF